MGQPLLCDAHQASGVMLMSTLIPPVESLVFCEECLPAQVALLFEQLGLMEAFTEVIRTQERARIEAQTAAEEQGRKPAAKKTAARKPVVQADKIDDEPAGGVA